MESVFRNRLVSKNQSFPRNALADPFPRNGPHVTIFINKSKGNEKNTALRIQTATEVQRIPTAVNLAFRDRSRYFFIQVAPQLSSRG
jgi:hypothetical protein